MLTDMSVVLSGALAVAWISGATRKPSEVGEPFNGADAAWGVVMFLETYKQLLPTILVICAATNKVGLLSVALSLDVDGSGEPPAIGTPVWLGGEDQGDLRRFCLALSLFVWRAEKLESLMQRMQRAAGHVKADGVGPLLSQMTHDPFAAIWPVTWGLTRRIALVAISSFGYIPFVQTVYPTVLLDEALWWTFAKVNDIWSRRVCCLPPVFDLVILPIVDLLHLLPVVVKVFLLGILAYPVYDAPAGSSLFLVFCAIAWTGHNCHVVYNTLFVDIPESTKQLWAAWRSGEDEGG